MGLLDAMIYGVRDILSAGVTVTRRSKVNFGTGLTAVDNAIEGRTDVSLTATPFSAPTGTGYLTVVAGVLQAAAATIGSGGAAFLATPSSANLATFVTDETGTGLLVFNNAPRLVTPSIWNPAVTFRYIFAGSAIVANRTTTLPLLGADDTFVFANHTQTLTGKTIDGATNALTVRIASDVSGLGSGMATFLTAPSSANLSATMTDKTGTGLCAFGTAPTFKTTINLNNPANTFKYVFTPSAILADRTITIPLLAANDVMVLEAFAQTLTSKTISGAVYVSIGTNPAASGGIRLPNGDGVYVRNAANSADLPIGIIDSSNNLLLGNQTAIQATRLWGAASVGMSTGSDTSYALLDAAGATLTLFNAKLVIGKAIIGDSAQSSPYGINGVAAQAMADANQTAAAAVYCLGTIKTTGAITANRTLTLPAATDALAYTKWINNTCTGAFGIVISAAGAGTTITVANARSALVLIDSRGVTRLTADSVLT